MKTVILEIYGELGAKARIDIDREDLSRAWALLDDSIVVGMAQTMDNWLSDLWILGNYRGQGHGAQLLYRAEQEIADRGCATALLRVVKANARAVDFYQRCGWHIEAEFPHEIFSVLMLRMRKDL